MRSTGGGGGSVLCTGKSTSNILCRQTCYKVELPLHAGQKSTDQLF